LSTDIERPWVPDELPASKQRKSILDAIGEVLEPLFNSNTDNARIKATSTCKEDSDEGTVTVDKVLLARLIKVAAPEGLMFWDNKTDSWQALAKTDVAEINSHMGWVQKRFGIDRLSMALKKAEHLALQNSTPAEPVEEPGPNTRRPVDGDPFPSDS
jgi:hypothetical protein